MHALSFHASHELAQVPSRAHATDAGLDLFTVGTRTLVGHQRTTLDTGLSVDIPSEHYGFIAPRSSTVHRFGLLVVPGVVDSGYTGELRVSVVNLTGDDVWIPEGSRLAQLILQPFAATVCQLTHNRLLRRSDRGLGGFGSTGA